MVVERPTRVSIFPLGKKIFGVVVAECHTITGASGDNDSPVGKFSNSGGGFHHLCFEVDNILKTLEQMEKNGARIIVKPTEGFENRQIAFVLLNIKNTNCNLIELAEKRKN